LRKALSFDIRAYGLIIALAFIALLFTLLTDGDFFVVPQPFQPVSANVCHIDPGHRNDVGDHHRPHRSIRRLPRRIDRWDGRNSASMVRLGYGMGPPVGAPRRSPSGRLAGVVGGISGDPLVHRDPGRHADFFGGFSSGSAKGRPLRRWRRASSGSDKVTFPTPPVTYWPESSFFFFSS